MPMDLEAIQRKKQKSLEERLFEFRKTDFIPGYGFLDYTIRNAVYISRKLSEYKNDNDIKRIEKHLLASFPRYGLLIVYSGVTLKIILKIIERVTN